MSFYIHCVESRKWMSYPESKNLLRLLLRIGFNTEIRVVLLVKNLPGNSGDRRALGSVPRSGRSSGVGNGNPLQHSCLENSMGRGAWRVTAT